MTTYNQPPQNYQFLEIFCICFSTQRIYLVISGGYETCTNQNRSYIADKKSVVHSPKLITSPTIEIPLVALAFDGRVYSFTLETDSHLPLPCHQKQVKRVEFLLWG